MRHKNNIAILDTETAGNFNPSLVYDIGWVVLDRELNISIVKEYLVQEVFENRLLMNTAYYASKLPKYIERVAQGEIELLPFRDIINELMSDMKKHNAKVLSAYNIAFDNRAIRQTMEVVASDMLTKWDKFNARLSKLCIWDLATDTLMQNEDFKEVAYEQGWISEKGNFQTNAEVAYRYLTKDYSFIEEHTALADVYIEYEILHYCLTAYKGCANYGLKSGSWQKVNRKVKKERNIQRYQELAGVLQV